MFLRSQHIVFCFSEMLINAVAAQEHFAVEVVPERLYVSRLMTKPTK